MTLPQEKSLIERNLAKEVILIYGRAKIGKSTLASQFPDALFIATEPGLSHLSVYKVIVNSWAKFLEVGREIIAGKHNFKTVVIDTIDNLVVYCAEYICQEHGINHPADMPHGKGFHLVTSELRRTLAKLSNLPYGLIMISHSELIEVETPTKKYSRWSLSIGGKNRNEVLSMADMILFLDSEIGKDGEERRIIRTKPSMSWEAGDRSGLLPAVLPLSYEALKNAYEQGGKNA